MTIEHSLLPPHTFDDYQSGWAGACDQLAAFLHGLRRVKREYPIVPVGLVGGDHVYQSLTTREGRWGRLSQGLTEKLSGRTDMALPIMHGIGPTLIPRPQRMYLCFAAPIDATKPTRVSEEKWVAAVKQNTQESLEQTLADLMVIRSSDPYRELNPMAWRAAAQPPAGR